MGHILHEAHLPMPKITITDGTYAYVDNPTNFEADYGSAFPALGAGEYIREYTSGLQHALFDDNLKFVGSGDLTWIDGETILSALNTLIAAKETRLKAALPLADLKTAGKNEIDSHAGVIRRKFITVAPGQEMTYLEKADQASDFVVAGYPADTSPYPFIQAEMDATGLTKEQAADGILAQKSAWITVGAAIEEHRLAGKAQVDAATDTAGVDTAVTNAKALLDAV